jgi:hypothetical protein
MPNTLPLPPLLCLLLLAMPGLLMLGLRLAAPLSNTPSDRPVFAVGLALAVWLLGIHGFGLLFQEFVAGLVAGTVLPALLGYGLWLKGFRPGWAWLPKADYALALGLTLLIVPATWGWDFHDKVAEYSSHFSITSQILNNIYPPHDIAFPNAGLRYHYGINTLFATVTALTRLPMDRAVDGVTLGLWFFALLLWGLIGKKLFGAHAFAWAMLIGALGGGLPWVAALLGQANNLTFTLFGIYPVGKSMVNPPLVSYFFQHPWTIGLPLMLLVLALLATRLQETTTPTHNRLFYVAVGLCLAVLGFSNVTAASTLSASLLGYSVLMGVRTLLARQPNRFYLGLGLTVLLGLFLGAVMSGMGELIAGIFAKKVETSGSTLQWAAQGIGGAGLWPAVVWNVATFGLLLPVGLWGLWHLTHPVRWVLVFLVAGGLFAVNVFEYSASWDIVKFGLVAQIALAVGAIGALVRLGQGGGSGRFLQGPLLVGLLAWGLCYQVPFWMKLPNIPFSTAFKRSPYRQTLMPVDVQAIAWLRQHIRPGQAVLCTEAISHGCAYVGGFPQFWIDGTSAAFGFPLAALEQRQALIRSLPDEITLYQQEGVQWLIIHQGTGPVTGAEPNTANHFKLLALVSQWDRSSDITPQVRFEKHGAIATVYAVTPHRKTHAPR